MTIEETIRRVFREELEAWQPSGPREWLTVPEAALEARVSDSTMYARIREGLVRSHRFGDRILVSRTELDEDIRSSPPADRTEAVA